MCSGDSGTGRAIASSTSVVPPQFHSTNTPYIFVHVSAQGYNLKNLQGRKVTDLKSVNVWYLSMSERELHFTLWVGYNIFSSRHNCGDHIMVT